MIHFGKQPFAGHVPVIGGPTPKNGIEQPNQNGWLDLSVAFDDRPDSVQK